MGKKKLHDLSVDIGPAVKVTFLKVAYVTGEKDYNKWYRLDIIFEDSQGRQIVKRLMEPSKDFDYKREYAGALRQLLNTFQKGAWEKIKRSKTFDEFYTRYIESINNHKGKECHIKTLPITHPVERDFVTAELAAEYISLKPMSYTPLEENQADDYYTPKSLPIDNKMPRLNDFSNHF